MSWLFSQAWVVESLEATCSGGEPCAQLNVMPTAQPFLRDDKTTDFSGHSLFGLTSRLLTASRGEELLTWFLADSRARTFRVQEAEQESKEAVRDSGKKWRALSVKYDLATSSWKTARSLFDAALPWSSVTLPKWGMMRSGELYQRKTPELRTSGSGCGLSLPTPTSSMMTSQDMEQARFAGTDKRRPKYHCATPTSLDWRSGKASQATLEKNSRPLSEQVGGSLNPTWVEWLMEFPIGWTDLGGSEMPRFRAWCDWHGVS